MDNRDKHLSFAHKHINLNWSKVLCSKFGAVRGLNVWVAVTQSGPFKVSLLKGTLFTENQYIQILNEVVLPFLVKHNDITYVQDSSVITESEIVRSWFKMHSEIKCITWPANCEVKFPISKAWSNMEKYVVDRFPLSCHETKKLIKNFWVLIQYETPKYLENSLTNMNSQIVKNEHLIFARQFKLDWNKSLFSTFGVVRCVSVWVAVTQFGPYHVSMSDDSMSVSRYLKILNEIVQPFLVENNDITYVQESNEITKSDVVRSWFEMHPEIKCITWTPIISPILQVWNNMNKYVDDNFPLTGHEIKRLIFNFWEKLMVESPNNLCDSFINTKRCFETILHNLSG